MDNYNQNYGQVNQGYNSQNYGMPINQQNSPQPKSGWSWGAFMYTFA